MLKTIKSTVSTAWRSLMTEPTHGKPWPLMKHAVPRDGAFGWYVFGSAPPSAAHHAVVTGIGLALAYVPSAARPSKSLRYITSRLRSQRPARHAFLRRIRHDPHRRHAHGPVYFTPPTNTRARMKTG